MAEQVKCCKCHWRDAVVVLVTAIEEWPCCGEHAQQWRVMSLGSMSVAAYLRNPADALQVRYARR